MSRRLDKEDEGELWQREGRDDGDAVSMGYMGYILDAVKTYVEKKLV